VHAEEHRHRLEEEAERKRRYLKKQREEEKRREFESYEVKALSTEQERLVSSVLKSGINKDIISESFNLQLTRFSYIKSSQKKCKARTESLYYREDLRRLEGLNWLNDEVINFYIELLKKRSVEEADERGYPKCHFFNTFFYSLLTKTGYDYSRVRKWTNKFNLFEFDKVFVPINQQNSHWTLAIINFQDKCFQYLDSFHSENYACLKVCLFFLS